MATFLTSHSLPARQPATFVSRSNSVVHENEYRRHWGDDWRVHMSIIRTAMRSARRPIPFLIVTLALLLMQRPGQAQSNAPQYFNNFFVTGDHRLYSVQTKNTGDPTTGFATTNMTVDNIPSSASPVAAYLYWATVA